MKKRFMCLLLTLCMVLTLIPVLSTQASAANLLWPVPGHTTLSRGFNGGNAIDISDGSIAGAKVVAAIGGTINKIFLCGEQHYGSDHDCYGFGTGVVVLGDDGYHQREVGVLVGLVQHVHGLRPRLHLVVFLALQVAHQVV